MPLPDEDRRLLRQELLVGHLLTLAASSGAVPPHALPAIAGMLQADGLIPKWLAFTLAQQPALFDRAFQRVFQQASAAPVCFEKTESTSTFEKRHPACNLLRPSPLVAPCRN